MATLTHCFGASHTPMLNTDDDEWELFIERDRVGKFLDRTGAPATFAELTEQAPADIATHISPDQLNQRFKATQQSLQRLRQSIEAANLDALIVVGDDQKELYLEDNLPSVLIYYGETIRNTPRHLTKPNHLEWFQRARAGYYEAEGGRDYPVDANLARHVIASLIDSEFDISTSNKLRDGEGEGHAFAFIHKRFMDGGRIVPIIPVSLNTYYPPNQPTPRRCYRLGQEIRKAVESYDADMKVGVIASGGLSHFVVDEELDTSLIEAMKAKDAEALCTMDRAKLNSGSSEIRNWICTAGAAEHLNVEWSEYFPCYRTEAGTGTGVCFAEWK